MHLFRKKRKNDFPQNYPFDQPALQDALGQYDQKISEAAENEYEYCCWNAWGFGAALLLSGLLRKPGFKTTLDSLNKAKLLLELAAQPMISMWHHNLEKQEPNSEQESYEAREGAFQNIQLFCSGMRSESRLKIAMGLDNELRLFLDRKRKSLGFYVGIFSKRYIECASGGRLVDWENFHSPIQSYGQFMAICIPDIHKAYPEALPADSDMTVTVKVYASIVTAAELMVRRFEANYK